MTTQQQVEIMQAMIKQYIKSRAKDYVYQHFPEDYKVVRKLYDIFTRGDEMFEYTCYDKMREGIENGIDSLVEDFVDKHNIISKFLRPFDIKVLSFYYSDFDDNELYKMCRILSCKNNRINRKRTFSSLERKRINMCEYICIYITNYI